MKVLIDVKDSKATFVLELLHSLSFVKAKTITNTKAQILEELNVAVEEMKLINKGKLKARPAKELLNEL